MTRCILLGFLLLLAACGGQGNPLAGTEWRLVALGEAGAPADVVGGDPTVRFTTGRDLTGWTGCNSYGAGYRVQVSEMGSFSVNYDLQVGPPPMSVDRYAEWCSEEFRELLLSDPDEPDVQEFLERHPWLVPGHATPGSPSGHFPLHCSLIAQPRLPGQHVYFPDFMWIATHTGAWYPTLIEIEKLSKRIYRKRGGLSSDFSQAQNQLNQWRTWFTIDANVAQFKEM